MKSSEVPASARDVFAWHRSPNALKKLIPGWEKVIVEQTPASLGDGATAVLVLHVGPLKLRWVPLGRLGEVLAGWHVRKKLARMFDYLHAATISAVQASRSDRGQ